MPHILTDSWDHTGGLTCSCHTVLSVCLSVVFLLQWCYVAEKQLDAGKVQSDGWRVENITVCVCSTAVRATLCPFCGITAGFILFQHLETVSKAKLHDWMILCHVHSVKRAQRQWHPQRNPQLGVHCKSAPVVFFLLSLLNSETRDLRWRKMLNNGIKKRWLLKKVK